jgi:predicted amidohydrolase
VAILQLPLGARVFACALSLMVVPFVARGLEKDITISVYQGRPSEGQVSENLSTARKIIEQARACQSDFLVFPELFLSGGQTRAGVEQGTRPLNDPEIAKFIAESSSNDMVIVMGMAHRAKPGDELHDTALVIHHGKSLGACDKILLTERDRTEFGFQPGHSALVFYAHGTRFGVLVGEDVSTPHEAMAARFQGAELLINPARDQTTANSGHELRQATRRGLAGLACELRMVAVRASTAEPPGRTGETDSFILSPQGDTVAEASSSEPELITARITRAMYEGGSRPGDFDRVPAWLRTQLAQQLTDFRRPANDDEMRYWLENMVVFHRFTPGEVSAATGLTVDEIPALLRKFDLDKPRPSNPASGGLLRVLPYPGGRHPRVGFLDGAVMPRRETKFSVFAPWDETSYVVADVPEAVWSNLGLIYLAHTHVLSLWDKRGIVLPRLEWERRPDGTLQSYRLLPNGVAFAASSMPTPTEVRMQLSLSNGTPQTLTGLRIQNCVMLKAAAGFAAQTSTNKLYQKPFAAVHDPSGRRWVITAWDLSDRCWGNDQVPCLHSDPKFADCPPGETVQLHGWLSFYEGTDVKGEFKRIESAGWLLP